MRCYEMIHFFIFYGVLLVVPVCHITTLYLLETDGKSMNFLNSVKFVCTNFCSPVQCSCCSSSCTSFWSKEKVMDEILL
jgi:hypothetical protein